MPSEFAAGALGGSSGLFIGYPFDTTKVQLQTQTVGSSQTRLLDAAKHIYHQSGVVKGFFRGLSGPLVTYSCTGSLFFGVYGGCLKYLEPNNERRNTAYSKVFLAGMTGGAVQVLPLVPIDHVKVLMQSHLPKHSTGRESVHTRIRQGQTTPFTTPVQCAKHIMKTQGVRGLYKGGMVMFFRDVPCFGVYCLTYQWISNQLKANNISDSQGIVADLIGGGCAGCLAWVSVMPLDVVKNRYQSDTKKIFKNPHDCAVKTYRQGGIKMFFRGSLVTCLRAFPVNAVEFMVFAQTLKYFESKNKFHLGSFSTVSDS